MLVGMCKDSKWKIQTGKRLLKLVTSQSPLLRYLCLAAYIVKKATVQIIATAIPSPLIGLFLRCYRHLSDTYHARLCADLPLRAFCICD